MSSFPYDSDTDHGASGAGRDGSSRSSHNKHKRDKDEEQSSGDHKNEEEDVDNEYYNFLHVARNASPEEISAAYKKLSRLYHPDKHLDDDKKRQAELMFGKLKNAYEVLSNPHKRAIYDCLGKKGLEEQGWEIVQRTKTPQEIREEYERLAKARAENRLQQRTNPTSRLQMSINATELFERYHHDERYDDVIEATLPSIEVSQITFGQTIEAPLTNTDNLTLSGNVSTQNGRGSGSVGCTLRRVSSEKSWHEVSTSVGEGFSLAGKAFRRLTARTFGDMSGSFQFTPRGLKPSFSASVGTNMSKTTMGYLTYSTVWMISEDNMEYALSEEESGMSTMIVRNGENFRLTASLQFGIPHTYFTASITRKFEANVKDKKREPLRLRGAIKVGTFGALLEYGIERKITPHNTLGATMLVGIPFGVTLRIKFQRSTQAYVFPLQLADEILMQPVFYGTIAPLLTWLTFKKLILDPYEANKRLQEKEGLKEANLLRVAEARKEALASVELMTERFNRIRQEEFTRRGFVVVFALYGKIFDEVTEELVVNVDELIGQSPEQFSEEYVPPILDKSREIIDVTIPVQCLVENSKLTFFEGNSTKSELAGFYDPCTLLHDDMKHLLIRYMYQGQVHQVVIADDEAMKLPKNVHRM